MDFVGKDEGARGGEEELVGGSDYGVGTVGGGSGSGGGDGAGRHVESVDLSALEVVDKTVGVVEGGVEGGNGVTVGDGASETVVTGGGGEGGEGAAGGGGPAGIAKGGLGPGVGGLGSIGVLPGGETSRDGVDSEGGGAALQSGTGLVGKTALEDVDTSDSDQDVSGRAGATPAITEGISKRQEVVAGLQAEGVVLIGAGLS